jgi:hypothetical protein
MTVVAQTRVAAEVPAVPISAFVPAAYRKGLVELARDAGVSLSSELREAIESHLRARGKLI